MLSVLLVSVQAQAAVRPNLVLILADDLGYGSVGCYGERQIPTPNIDRLAKEGARYTDAYVSCPLSAPTRAGLLTGRYQQRFGFEHNPGPQRPADGFGLPLDEKTIAEVLGGRGYRTGMVGKWHVGSEEGRRPFERGFESFFGFLGGAHPYFKEPRQLPIYRKAEVVNETEYLTDAFAREARAFVSETDSRPFFLYLPFNAVHAPLQAPEADLARFGKLEGDRKTFAGMLTALDRAVGSVTEALRKSGKDKNTLIVFLSDNGGPTLSTTSKNGPLRGYKAQVFEGGIRVPFIVRWPGQVPAGKTVRTPTISLDIFPTLLEAAGAVGTKRGLEGKSLLPELQGRSPGDSQRPLFWRMGNQHAVRAGDWKLVFRDRQTQLYNLKQDIGESRDLSAKELEKLGELQALYRQWDAKNVAPLWRPAPNTKRKATGR